MDRVTSTLCPVQIFGGGLRAQERLRRINFRLSGTPLVCNLPLATSAVTSISTYLAHVSAKALVSVSVAGLMVIDLDSDAGDGTGGSLRRARMIMIGNAAK